MDAFSALDKFKTGEKGASYSQKPKRDPFEVLAKFQVSSPALRAINEYTGMNMSLGDLKQISSLYTKDAQVNYNFNTDQERMQAGKLPSAYDKKYKTDFDRILYNENLPPAGELSKWLEKLQKEAEKKQEEQNYQNLYKKFGDEFTKEYVSMQLDDVIPAAGSGRNVREPDIETILAKLLTKPEYYDIAANFQKPRNEDVDGYDLITQIVNAGKPGNENKFTTQDVMDAHNRRMAAAQKEAAAARKEAAKGKQQAVFTPAETTTQAKDEALLYGEPLTDPETIKAEIESLKPADPDYQRKKAVLETQLEVVKDNVQRMKAEEAAQKKQEEKEQKHQEYLQLPNNVDDFGKYSALGMKEITATAKGRFMSELMNSDSTIPFEADIGLMGSEFGLFNIHEIADDYLKYLYMTSNEAGVYYYLAGKDKANGTKEADKYLKFMDPILNQRKSEQFIGNLEEFSTKNTDNATLASLLSVPMTFLEGKGYLYGLIQKASGNDIDPYATALEMSRAKQAIRGSISDMANNEVLSFAYNTVMSIADFALLVGTTGGAGVVGEALTLGAMGSSAATSTMVDVLDRGGSDEQALIAGGIAGIAEVLFEKIGLDNFIDNFIKMSALGKRSAIMNILKQAGIEALEETATEIANIITDTLVMGELSNYDVAVQNYMMKPGMSEQEAKKRAAWDLAKQIGMAGLAGAFSGFAVGSGGQTLNTSRISEIGAEMRNMDGKDGLIETGLSMPGTEAYTHAESIGENPSNYDLGNQYILNVQAQQAEQRAAFEQDIQTLGVSPQATETAMKLYDRFNENNSTRTLKKLHDTVRAGIDAVALVDADLNVSRVQAKTRLNTLYSGVRAAMQSGNTLAFQQAVGKYMAAVEVAQAKMQAEQVKARNKTAEATRQTENVIAEIDGEVQAQDYAEAEEIARQTVEYAEKMASISTHAPIDNNGNDNNNIQYNATNIKEGGVINGRGQEAGAGILPRDADVSQGNVRGNQAVDISNNTEYTQEFGTQQGGEGSQGNVRRRGTALEGKTARAIRGLTATPEAEQSLQRHIQRVQEATGQTPDIRIVNEVDPRTAEILDFIKDITGRDVLLYESNDTYGNGWTDGKNIYLRVNGSMPIAATFGHEVAHADPAINAAGMSVVERMSNEQLRRYKEYRDSHISSHDDADIRRELVADMYGRMVEEIATGLELDNYGIDRGTIEQFYLAFNDAMGAPYLENVENVVEMARQFEAESDMEYSRIAPNPSFADQVNAVINDVKNNRKHGSDHILVGSTPSVLTRIGFNSLPVMMTAQHVETAYFASGRKSGNYHDLGETLKLLPEAIENPIMIIESATHPNTSVVMLVNLMNNKGEQIITPVLVDGSGRYNNILIDANIVTSMHPRPRVNIAKLLKDAFIKEMNGQIGVYYADAIKSRQIANTSGLQLPSGVAKGGYIHSIRDPGSPVNLKHQNITQTRQFKHWFGNWEVYPEKSSKVVDDQGQPLVVYHGSPNEFTVFDRAKIGQRGTFPSSRLGFFFTVDRQYAEVMGNSANGKNIYEVYLDIKNPLRVASTEIIQNSDVADIEAKLAKGNYDGIIDSLGNFVVFSPEQIKSATDNIGTFDPTNPDIYYSRIRFTDADGNQYSYQMPTIREKKDGTFVAEFQMGGEKIKIEGPDRAALEERIDIMKQEYAYKNTSRPVLNQREASVLFRDGVTVLDYAQSGSYNHEVGKLLRGMYLRNGLAVGGELGANDLATATANAEYWKNRPKAWYTATSPVRLFEELGNWRNDKAPQARALNWLEGKWLADKYFGFVAEQGANANLWMREQSASIREAFDGDIRTSTLAQMLGEGIATEQDAQNAIYDSESMIVSTQAGTFVFDSKGQLKALSSGGELAIFDENYYKRQQRARKEIAQLMQNRDPKITHEEHLQAIREAEQRATQGNKPVRKAGDIRIERSGSTVKAIVGGQVIAEITNGKHPNLENVQRLTNALQSFYADVLVQQNSALVNNGYAPIKARQNYFPHIGRQSHGVQDFINTLKGEAETLPTSIAGLTSTFEPGKPFITHMLQRMGNKTEFDAIRGFNKYVQSAADLIHYTPAIQRIRQLEKALRESGGTQNSALTSWLHNYANTLANKKSDLDRGLEDMLGREAYTIADKLTKWFGAASVAGNISSALSNIISLLSSIPSLQHTQLPKAIKDTILSNMPGNQGDGFADKIPMLARRFGRYEPITTDTTWKTVKRGGSKFLGFAFEAIDHFAVETAARAKYQELMSKGYTEADTINQTSAFVVKMFAERSKGMTPALFNSKVFRPFVQFQLEPLNQLSHFRDMQRQHIGEQVDELIRQNNGVVDGIDWAAAENRLSKFGLKGLRRAAEYLILMFLWNLFTRWLMGRDQAIDLIGMGVDAVKTAMEGGNAFESLGESALDQLPFASMFTGGRVPLMGGVENLGNAIETIADKDASTGDKLMAGMKGVSSFIPGGAQLSKSIRGADANAQGGAYTDSGKLRYPISDEDYWKVLLFGPSAAAPEGFDYQKDTLSEARTRNFKELVGKGVDPDDAYGFLREMNSKTKPDKLVSIITYDGDKDGVPDFNPDTQNMIAAMLGINIDENKSLDEQAKKAADDYLKGKETDYKKDRISEDELEQAQADHDFWLTVLGY